MFEDGAQDEQKVWPQLKTIGFRIFENTNLQLGQFMNEEKRRVFYFLLMLQLLLEN